MGNSATLERFNFELHEALQKEGTSAVLRVHPLNADRKVSHATIPWGMSRSANISRSNIIKEMINSKTSHFNTH